MEILHADGRITPCTVARLFDGENGYTRWKVVPPAGVEFRPITGDRLHATYIPPATELMFWVEGHPPVAPGMTWYAEG